MSIGLEGWNEMILTEKRLESSVGLVVMGTANPSSNSKESGCRSCSCCFHPDCAPLQEHRFCSRWYFVQWAASPLAVPFDMVLELRARLGKRVFSAKPVRKTGAYESLVRVEARGYDAEDMTPFSSLCREAPSLMAKEVRFPACDAVWIPSKTVCHGGCLPLKQLVTVAHWEKQSWGDSYSMRSDRLHRAANALCRSDGYGIVLPPGSSATGECLGLAP